MEDRRLSNDSRFFTSSILDKSIYGGIFGTNFKTYRPEVPV